ncbi:nucleotidyltransferase family protein [Colwellia sp. UCD-KL20]|uniref:nucleotidyltransferase family protein n=1 Tax=Colwellia sp. UCD-KL20 TaxID=1917165 RepID=UPI0009710A58|nr:nucleotidyltransferase family protein [Colwellia sp. UCD-KL20]
MKDDKYYKLLYLARSSVGYEEKFDNLDEVVSLINEIKYYSLIHKRIISLIKSKAVRLNIFTLLSSDVQRYLNDTNNQAVVSEMIKREQLNKIVKLFSKDNIDIILLKGMAFNYSLYTDTSPRVSNDIDILVKEKDWLKAKEILNSIMKPLTINNAQVFDDLYETTFIPENKFGAVVDLHKSLIHPILFNIKEQDIWMNSHALREFDGQSVRVLSPEHNLVHQALHAYKDMEFSKYNLVDTYEIMKIRNINLNKAIAISEQWGAKVPLYFLLQQCVSVMGLTIEREVLQSISPNNITKLIANKLLNSEHSKLKTNKKSIKYRINQLISQFIFTSSFRRPINFQWLYLKTAINQFKK